MKNCLETRIRLVAVALLMLTLSGCAYTWNDENVPPMQGPPISDIVTPFDTAMKCLRGRINSGHNFAVGAIIDNTGKEQMSEGGTGKFVTQGAGDIVQSALMLAGVSVVNRRDPRIITTEIQLKIGPKDTLVPSSFFITGSINTLDFIPGGGLEFAVAGGGPRFRQHRILVSLDLFLTETRTGRILASVPLQKEIVANEAGVGLGRFFGTTLVNVDIGGFKREAVQSSLRQMLYLATFELLTQVMNVNKYADCRSEIDQAHGRLDQTRTAEKMAAHIQINNLQIPPDEPQPKLEEITPVRQGKMTNKNQKNQEQPQEPSPISQEPAGDRGDTDQPKPNPTPPQTNTFWEDDRENQRVIPPGVLW
jgi:curli biogenesis system outer membrane secretion channel CsgG